MRKGEEKSDLRQQMDQTWFKRAEKNLPVAYQQFGIEIRRAHDRMVEEKNYAGVWRHLERAHIVSQSSAWRHFCVHFVMFGYALTRFDLFEALGQVPRMLLAVPSSLLGKAPRGNTGRSNVGMFASLPIPKDLERVLGVAGGNQVELSRSTTKQKRGNQR